MKSQPSRVSRQGFVTRYKRKMETALTSFRPAPPPIVWLTNWKQRCWQCGSKLDTEVRYRIGNRLERPHFPAVLLSTLHQQRPSAVYGVPWLGCGWWVVGVWGVWGRWGGCEAAKWAHYRGILPSPGEPSKTHHNPYKTKHITFP